MTEYVSSALFIYSPESEQLVEHLQANTFGISIVPMELDVFKLDPDTALKSVGHVVVSSPLEEIKIVLGYAMQRDFDFSVGILPQKSQKNLKKYFALPAENDAAIELALQRPEGHIDIILCNGKILLFKATIGRLPLLDSPEEITPWGLISKAITRLRGLKLLGFQFTTEKEKKVVTAASGCMIVQHAKGSLAARTIRHHSGFSDGLVSLAVVAPLSIFDYFKFISQVLQRDISQTGILSTVGLIQSPKIDIESDQELDVKVDGVSVTKTPLHCEVIPESVRINIGPVSTGQVKKKAEINERLDIGNLPTGNNEVTKAKKKAIPFFPYASEERFKDLFLALRDDAQLSSSYLVLMFLSTMLATMGLYLNSSSVIIGAMLLAPLMAPMISLSMGLLRQEQALLLQSIQKIAIGIFLALSASALMALLFPHNPVTNEMAARLSPGLLDLGVALFAGIAGAYTKSHKEILQSLAGVAIAVALVPPLAVAGTGLGRLDFNFFGEAFLLFSTNLIGITLAATVTFRVLGYSPAIQNKRSLGVVALLLALISVPLYFSYDNIVEKMVMEKSWKKERFLVNGKYLIVRKANLEHHGDKLIITMEILARETLSREDLDLFQKKIQRYYSRKIVIRADVIYIL